VPPRAFRLAYDGRPFSGFQRQPDVPTVEGTLFDALRELGVCEGDVPDGYAAAGRTDAGVSARAQTAALDTPDWLTPAALNGALPGTVRAWASADVGPEFHATRDATRRTYRYHCHAPDVDDDRARAALDVLSGEHDFHNLTPDETGTVRTLDTGMERDGEFLSLTFAADGFARHMVRRLVSLVRAVAAGEDDIDRVGRVLGPESLSGPDGVATAPATPLVLVDVTYPGVAFAVDADAAASLRGVFGERRIEALTAARVAGTVRSGVESE
jgi:tRNA pseudouridine38-40 synthase